MALTVHDITMNADLFRAAYSRWPSAETPDPPALPPVTGRELADYRDMPGYAVPWPPRGDGSEPSETAQRMTRLLAGED